MKKKTNSKLTKRKLNRKRSSGSVQRVVSHRTPITQMDHCILCNNIKAHADGCSMPEIQRRIRAETAKDLVEIIPTNWCDSLLTGPSRALTGEAGKWGCPDIERLLNAIKSLQLKVADDRTLRPEQL